MKSICFGQLILETDNEKFEEIIKEKHKDYLEKLKILEKPYENRINRIYEIISKLEKGIENIRQQEDIAIRHLQMNWIKKLAEQNKIRITII
jgi:hypothetical protein